MPSETIKQIKEEKRWSKKCYLILLYHTEQLTSHGKQRPTKWRLEDTALELGLSLGFISESLTLAKAMVSHKLYDCQSREEALKKLKNESQS